MRDRLGQVTAFRVDALQSAPTPELSPGTATGPAGSMTARSPGSASTAAGFTRPRRLVGVLHGRQSRAQVEELADPLLCRPGHRPGEERRFSRAIARSGGYSRSSRPASARSAA
jgi:hypothetical protein